MKILIAVIITIISVELWNYIYNRFNQKFNLVSFLDGVFFTLLGIFIGWWLS